MLQGKITPDEFRAITLQVITEVAEMKAVNENKQVEENTIDITQINAG
jgi:hypothetical protein